MKEIDEMSKIEFEDFLNKKVFRIYSLKELEFEFDRNNMRNLTEEESDACQRALDKMSKPTGVKLF